MNQLPPETSSPSGKKRLGLLMSTEVGLLTQYLNWREHFPDDLDIEPVWLLIDFEGGGLLQKLPLPKVVRGKIRGQIEIAEALKQGPFDGIFVAVHSALALFPHVLDTTPCFMSFDVTPKQLNEFGSIYEKGPSRIAAIERAKHQRRALAYQKCKMLFPWSQWAADSAVTDYGACASNIQVIPPGVDLVRWAPKDRFERPAKTVCDLLFVGGDFERKGGPMLLEWARKSQSSSFKLHIVTKNHLDGLNDPRICVYNDTTPNDPKLVELYSQADVFVLPTLADCYSLASIEAMASGLPVVLAKIGGTADVIRNGETGFLIESGSAEALSIALETLIADPQMRERMGRAARQDAEKRYSAGANIRQTVEMIRGIL